jgi:hypothetical protein
MMNAQQIADHNGHLRAAIIKYQAPRVQLVVNISRRHRRETTNNTATKLRSDVAGCRTRLKRKSRRCLSLRLPTGKQSKTMRP